MTEISNHTIPLRKDYLKVPKHRRSKRAISKIKRYVKKHAKVDDVKIGNDLNTYVWKDGIKNPPGKVEVEILKDDSSASVDRVGNLSRHEETTEPEESEESVEEDTEDVEEDKMAEDSEDSEESESSEESDEDSEKEKN